MCKLSEFMLEYLADEYQKNSSISKIEGKLQHRSKTLQKLPQNAIICISKD